MISSHEQARWDWHQLTGPVPLSSSGKTGCCLAPAPPSCLLTGPGRGWTDHRPAQACKRVCAASKCPRDPGRLGGTGYHAWHPSKHAWACRSSLSVLQQAGGFPGGSTTQACLLTRPVCGVKAGIPSGEAWGQRPGNSTLLVYLVHDGRACAGARFHEAMHQLGLNPLQKLSKPVCELARQAGAGSSGGTLEVVAQLASSHMKLLSARPISLQVWS